MIFIRVLVFSVTVSIVVPALAGVNGWDFLKLAIYEQTADNAEPANPTWAVYAAVYADSGDATLISLVRPGFAVPLELVEVEPGEWELDTDYLTKTELDTDFPAGSTNLLILSGGALGTLTQEVVVASDEYPATPYLTGSTYSGFQSLETLLPAFVGWNQMWNYGLLSIFPTGGGAPIFEEEGYDGIQVPAGILAPGNTYIGNMEHFNEQYIPAGGFSSPGRMGFISLVAFDINAVNTATAYDDFNDNLRDVNKWSVFRAENGASLSEVNGHLELTSSESLPGSDRSAVWEWMGAGGSYTQDWVITYDTVNVLDENAITNNEVWFGMLAMFESFDNSFGIDRNKGNEPGDTYHTIVADATSGGTNMFIEHRNATSDEITFCIAFDSLTKTLHGSYDEGDGFVPYTNVNVSSWGMTDTNEFSFFLFGGNLGMEIGSNQVYGDNFRFQHGFEPLSNEVDRVDISYARNYGVHGTTNDDSLILYFDMETSYDVSSIAIESAAGNQYELSGDPEGEILEWIEARDYEFPINQPWDSANDGDWTVTFGFRDGSFRSTIIPFSKADSSPLPNITNEAYISSPYPLDGLVTNETTFDLQWAGVDPDSNFLALEDDAEWERSDGFLRFYTNGLVDVIGFVDIIDGPLSSTNSGPISFSKGMHELWLVQGYAHTAHNDEGIPFLVGKFTESEYAFGIGSVGPFNEVLLDGDDFNDNAMDPNKWAVGFSNPGIFFHETNQQLVHTSSGDEGFVSWEWQGEPLSITQDWAVVVDISNLINPSALFWENADFGISVASAEYGFDLRHTVRDVGYALQSQAFDPQWDYTSFSDLQPSAESNVTLKIEFHSVNRTFYSSYSIGGEFIALTNDTPEEWEADAYSVFTPVLFVDNSYVPVASGEMAADNFRIYNLVPANENNPDADADGLPDAWEIGHFGAIDAVRAGAADDWDNDGQSNFDEYISGMNPTNASSRFAAALSSVAAGGESHFVISWNAVSNRVYDVLWSPQLGQGFEFLKTGIQFPQNSCTDTVHRTSDTCFYRVIVRMPISGDIDADGLPDGWENLHFSGAAIAEVDSDGDQVDNRAEYIAGTDPNDPASVLEFTRGESSAHGFVLEWTAVTGRVYSIHWSNTPGGPFQPLEASISHPQNSYTDTTHNAESGGYYNLKVELGN